MKRIELWLVLGILIRFSAIQAAPHLLILTIDTFRPDFVGCFHPTADPASSLTPALDSLAGESVVFSRCYATSAWTSPGLVSILTGLYPSSHQVTSRDRSIPPTLPTLFKLITPIGYQCQDICYLTVIPNFYHLGMTPYPEREQYLNSGDQILFHYLENYRSTAPFGLWYHYRDLHIPYEADFRYLPSDFKTMIPSDSNALKRYRLVTTMPVIHYGSVAFLPTDSLWVKPLYGSQVKRMDTEFIAPLIRQLKAQAIWDDLILIITADHGEELLEHGFVGHGSTSLNSRLYNEIIHIPLIIKFPRREYAGRKITDMVQQIDLVPTILDYLHIPIPQSLQGQSLIPLLQGDRINRPFLMAETNPGGYQADPSMLNTEIKALFNSKAKLIRTRDPSNSHYEFYDLYRDPKEKTDLYPAHHSELNILMDGLEPKISATPESSQTASIRIPDTVRAHSQLMIPTILVPKNSDRLSYQLHQGAIHGEWTGPDSIWYILNYQVGSGSLSLKGEFRVFGNRHVFGPFSPAMWNTLAIYNPWVFRVYPEGRPDLQSRRLDFTLTAYQPNHGHSPSSLALFFFRSRPLISSILTQSPLFSRYGLIGIMILTLLGILIYAMRYAPPGQGKANLCLALFLLVLQFHFFTLGVMPLYWEKLYHWAGGGEKLSGYSLYLGGLFFFLFILVYLIRRRTRIWWKIMLDALTIIGLLLVLYHQSIAATRFHIFIYTLLGLLLIHYLHYRGRSFRTSLITSVLMMSFFSLLDELIQFYLPIRYFGLDDIWINLLSSLAGISLGVSMLSPSPHPSRPSIDQNYHGYPPDDQ
ncbi:MAG: VanZ family protein [Candidatus Delongbacteria bacterium]|nr:VanZ family protein [Candidatus Delongbacteria bacterium]